jgi:hypothetical protein
MPFAVQKGGDACNITKMSNNARISPIHDHDELLADVLRSAKRPCLQIVLVAPRVAVPEGGLERRSRGEKSVPNTLVVLPSFIDRKVC